MTGIGSGTFATQVKAQLGKIETRLVSAVESNSPFVTTASKHIINAGGKRFRPLVLVLSALASESGPVDQERLEKAAVVVELTHVASLYHDDVMDEADIRRGIPSANSEFGNSMAILVGDYQLTQASILVSELGIDFVRLQAETFSRLVHGQIAEYLGPQGANPLEHYLGVIRGKTAALISTAAVFGAWVAGADRQVVEALRSYGEEIGMAFQISDDIIDITSDNTGKTPGTDLREGVWTLPTIMLRASKNAADQELVDFIDSGLKTDEDLTEAVTRLRRNPVIEQSTAEVARRADVARNHLTLLPEGAAKESLLGLCDHLVTRTS